MNWNFLKCASILTVVAVLVIGCDSKYTRTVREELSKDTRQDSLLFGVRFGQTREEFYGKCYDLNKQKLVSQGVGFSVRYVFIDSVTQNPPRSIDLLFYPKFDSLNYIKGMDMEFFYSGWNPAVRDMQSDSLGNHLKKILHNWYKGNDFMDVKIDGQQVPVKIDANRRITVKIEDTQRILVQVQDMVHPDYRHDGVSVNENLERKRK